MVVPMVHSGIDQLGICSDQDLIPVTLVVILFIKNSS